MPAVCWRPSDRKYRTHPFAISSNPHDFLKNQRSGGYLLSGRSVTATSGVPGIVISSYRYPYPILYKLRRRCSFWASDTKRAVSAGSPTGNLFVGVIPCPVSYTHLRAHETVLDLVCRL